MSIFIEGSAIAEGSWNSCLAGCGVDRAHSLEVHVWQAQEVGQRRQNICVCCAHAWDGKLARPLPALPALERFLVCA